MSVKLRLRRMGRRKVPAFSIVATDSRDARDGRYIEDLGRYYPLDQPAQVSIKEERVRYWLRNGAQPSDTVRSLLSKQGLLLANHLELKGKSEPQIQEAVEEHRAMIAEKGEEFKMTAEQRRQKALEAERQRVKELEEEERRKAEEARKRKEEEARKKKEAEEAAQAKEEAEDESSADEEEAAAETTTEADTAESDTAEAEEEAATDEADADEAPADEAEDADGADAEDEEAADADGDEDEEEK